MELFEPPETRVQLGFKVRTSLKLNLKDVERLWKALAIARGTNPDDIDLTYVCERMLTAGVETAWAQLGHSMGLAGGKPANEEEWAKLERTILKRAEQDRSTRNNKK